MQGNTPHPPAEIRHLNPKPMIASWYGCVLHGRKTAWHFNGKAGDWFDSKKFTCAHRTLPFGTVLVVYYKNNMVQVTVTDRGPTDLSRDIDLSEAAASKLGFKTLGVVRVWVVET